MNNEDMSNIFEKLSGVIDKDKISPDMINNLMNMFGNSNKEEKGEESDSKTEETANNTIDIETLLKIKTIIDKMKTTDDPRSNLLQSLKPYLNEKRKTKVDQYIQLMNMSKIMDIMPFLGGDNNRDGKQ